MERKRLNGPLKERLLSMLKKIDSGCWIWQGNLNRRGYGLISYAGKKRSVHRVAYTELVGPIPDGHDIDHICWQRACCNPDHLRAMTASENRKRQRSALLDTCKHGHPLSGQNLYIRPTGARQCRRCNLHAARRLKSRRAA